LWTGALGFIWLIFWWWLYDIPTRQKRLSAGEFAYIHSDPDELTSDQEQPSGWSDLFRLRQTWAIILGKFLTDPVWWFYLFWIPSYFNTIYHLNLTKSAIHVSTVYVVASFGSILGGYLSDGLLIKAYRFIRREKFPCSYLPAASFRFFVRYTVSIWPAVWLISLAAAAHQAWSATIYTLAGDMFPKQKISSVIGIGGMAGSVGGILFPLLIGILLDHFKLIGLLSTGYNIIFCIGAIAYLIAGIFMQVLSPKMLYVGKA
jgi:ACS family hexuronate transporter-like MFS transporter